LLKQRNRVRVARGLGFIGRDRVALCGDLGGLGLTRRAETGAATATSGLVMATSGLAMATATGGESFAVAAPDSASTATMPRLILPMRFI
jgi:hypothetical protein